MKEGKFTLKDMEMQFESLGQLGSMDKLMSFIPGLGKAKIPEGMMEQQQSKIKNWKAAIKSMTKEEVENPDILEKESGRIQRVAKGSGASTSDIRALIKQYKMIKEMIHSQGDLSEGKMDHAAMMKFAKKFAKKIRM